MKRFKTCQMITTGCRRRAKVLYPADIILELDENHPKIKGWIKKKMIKEVPAETPLTSTSVIRERNKRLLIKR